MKKLISARRALVYGALTASLIVVGGCGSDDDDDMSVADPNPPGTDVPDGTVDPGDVDGDVDGDDVDGDDDTAQETVNADGTSTFVVPLSGAQEVPPVDAGEATGEGNLTIDRASGVVTGSVAVSGLSGPAQAAHIHRGFAGTNGPVLIPLTGNDDGTLWSVPDGADGTLDTDGLAGLANGELYLNVHTEANPAGEIRGQIVPDGVELEDTELSGDREVPPVTTDASGTGVSTLDEDSGAISATVVTDGIVATAAHIHVGAEGMNGDVIITLEQDAGNAAIWRTPAGAMLTPEQVTAYGEDGLYFNVHSDANPSGEIRGQL